MKNSLLLISLLLSINAFSQSYQEEDFYGFWLKQKTTFKNPEDGVLFLGIDYFPVNFLFFKSDNTLKFRGFSEKASVYSLYTTSSIWELLPKEKRLKMAAPDTPEKYNLLPIKTFKPGKKLVLTHPLTIRDKSENSNDNISITLEKSVIELLLTYRKCSKEEALNVSLIDSLYILNREVNNIEWRDYAYDLENKDEIIYSDQIATNESIVKQFDPLLNITHEEAVAFCEWRARQIKNLFDLDVVVRLPTQKEWEVLSPSIKNGSRYRMNEGLLNPDLSSIYLKKPVKLLTDAYEWCAESGLVYSPKSGAEPISAASATKTGFRYIIEFR